MLHELVTGRSTKSPASYSQNLHDLSLAIPAPHITSDLGAFSSLAVHPASHTPISPCPQLALGLFMCPVEHLRQCGSICFLSSQQTLWDQLEDGQEAFTGPACPARAETSDVPNTNSCMPLYHQLRDGATSESPHGKCRSPNSQQAAAVCVQVPH